VAWIPRLRRTKLFHRETLYQERNAGTGAAREHDQPGGNHTARESAPLCTALVLTCTLVKRIASHHLPGIVVEVISFVCHANLALVQLGSCEDVCLESFTHIPSAFLVDGNVTCVQVLVRERGSYCTTHAQVWLIPEIEHVRGKKKPIGVEPIHGSKATPSLEDDGAGEDTWGSVACSAHAR
jgi:hypothetical protein